MLEGIEQIRRGLQALAEVDLPSCTDDELREAVVELEKLNAQFRGQQSRVFQSFDIRGCWRPDGSRSAAAWLARRTNKRIESARADARLAKQLRSTPLTQAALVVGDINEQHARRLGRLASSPRDVVREAFVEHEAQLVEWARDMSYAEFEQAVRYWENAADPDGAEDKVRDDHQARKVHCSQTFRDTWRLDGQLDPVAGAEFAAALERIYDELLAADWREIRERFGKDATADQLLRTAPQRRADALVEMARRAVAAPIGARLPEPLITVLVGYESLQGPVLELFNDGTVATPGQIANLLSHADVERVVFDPTSRDITDLGRRTRFYRGARRRVIEIRDRHCTFPGCTLPADRCDVDHVSPWAEGGETTQSNGRLRCGHHNRHRGPEDPNHNPTDPRLPLGTTDEDEGDNDVWDDTILEAEAAEAAEAAGADAPEDAGTVRAARTEVSRPTVPTTHPMVVTPPPTPPAA